MKTKFIRLILLGLLVNIIGVMAATVNAANNEWQSIFNGKDLTGWTAKLKGYPLGEDPKSTFRVEKGLLRVSYDNYKSFDKDFGHLYYHKELSHYRLRFDYRFRERKVKVGPKRNSGVMIHSQPPETMTLDQKFPISIESQLLGGETKGKERPTGNVCTPGTDVNIDGKRVKKHCINSTSKTYYGDQWVHFEVEVRGDDVIRHYVNGEQVFELTKPVYANKDKKNAATKSIEGDALEITKGYIALQAESHDIDFRNIELMELDHKHK